MSKKQEVILLGVAVLIVVVTSFWQWRGKQKTNLNTSETIVANFCGTEYEAPKIIINGVDVIARIAEVASAEEDRETCDNIKSVSLEKLEVDFEKEPYGPGWYSMHLNGNLFRVDSNENVIHRPGEGGIYPWHSLN